MATGTIKSAYTVVRPVDPGKQLLCRITKQYASITFNSAGYYAIDTIPQLATWANVSYINNYTMTGMMIQGFSTGDVYGVVRGSDPGAIYAIGKPNATVTFSVQYFFLNTAPDVH